MPFYNIMHERVKVFPNRELRSPVSCHLSLPSENREEKRNFLFSGDIKEVGGMKWISSTNLSIFIEKGVFRRTVSMQIETGTWSK